MDNLSEIQCQLALSMIPRVGFRLWHMAIEKASSACNIYNNPSVLDHNNEFSIIRQSVLKQEFLYETGKILFDCKSKGVKIISYFDEDYPRRLKQISTPPCFLYVRGSLELNNQRIISIIGTRTPSQYGKDVVLHFIDELKDYDVTIVSGMAYGIDVLAHKQALKNDISTMAVIAGGLDKIYPSIHKPICDEVVAKGGAVITESPLGTKPENFLFPARNRIIAGCSDAVLIIEAGKNSGTIITAICANDYDREVFTVPGNIYSPMSEGCNNMIKENNAHLVTCAKDIADIMNWDKKETISTIQNNATVTLQDNDKLVFDVIKDNPNIHIDNIADKTNISSAHLAAILLKLELKEFIEMLPGNKYKIRN